MDLGDLIFNQQFWDANPELNEVRLAAAILGFVLFAEKGHDYFCFTCFDGRTGRPLVAKEFSNLPSKSELGQVVLYCFI